MASPKPTPTLTLFRGFPATNRHVPSPFVNKLEARLRIGGLPYRIDSGSPMKAPRGKIPYVELRTSPDSSASSSPEQLADSALIARRLVEDGFLADLNDGLTGVERARDGGVRAVLEDKVYFYQVRERWVDNYYAMRDSVLGFMPYPVRVLVGLLAYRNVAATLRGQGTLRYTGEEMAALRLEVWEGVNAMLVESRSKALAAGREGPFWVLGGERPTEADPTVFGFVAAALACEQAPATEQVVRSFPVVMEYAKRIHDQYFSDYECWQD